VSTVTVSTHHGRGAGQVAISQLHGGPLPAMNGLYEVHVMPVPVGHIASKLWMTTHDLTHTRCRPPCPILPGPTPRLLLSNDSQLAPLRWENWKAHAYGTNKRLGLPTSC
jgi:hypothetical protein